ncbi:TerD family protein [Streptomyces antimicrobicus]|uniref:TerD domain-containing protein n=1 Tax=Streptomyces antimicrobicus TaxID=2883108 RepID=A0ABS8AZK2_9ACTN|nr:TerD family protein [Streptomyces antimicrobicus]MCB5177786.1 TerD domain-containing protein [Streptomyces antimicrobicus]
MTTLAKGGNAVLSAAVCRVTLTSPTTGIDVSAVLLGQGGKVRSDEDLVFYNNSSESGIELEGQTIVADLAAVPTAIDRIAVVASIDPELPATHFDASNTPRAVVECGDAHITFEPPPLMHRETAAILIELYRRAGSWKVRAVGQGWDTGLAGLASDFGIIVDDPGPSAGPVSSAADPAPVQRTPSVPPPSSCEPRGSAAQVPALPPMSVRPLVPLGKVALTKAGQATIDMRKDDPSLIVTATLEWNGGSTARRQAGADLDLYALYVPGNLVTPVGRRPSKSDQVVYYRQLGSLDAPPYIALDGDSRVPGRETITIRRPDLQGYVLLCAYSAVENGTGSFKSYGARVVVTDGRGSTVTVPLFNNRNLSYWVAVSLIDFTVPGAAQIRHVEKYSGNHVEARPTLYSNGNFRMSTGKVEFKTT